MFTVKVDPVSSIQVEPALNSLPLFINLFLIPALSVYLYYKSLKKPLTPHLELLFQYCIAASFNYVFTKTLLYIPKRLIGVNFEMDSAHYGLIALFSAWLLSQLFCFAQKIKIAIDVTSVTESTEKPEIQTRENEEKFRDDKTEKQ